MGLKNKISPKWILVVLMVFAVNFALLLGSRFLLGSQLTGGNYLAFAGLCGVVALISGLGALGLMAFFSSFVMFNGFALVYLYWITLTQKSSGWADLTSLAGYFMMLLAGVAVGVILELLSRFLGKRKKDKV